MLTEKGRVLAIEEDGLWVETVRRSVCGACVARNGCGHHLLSKYTQKNHCVKAVFHHRFSGHQALISGSAQRDWQVGDSVVVGVDQHRFVIAALLVYLLPLVCMLAFTLFASALDFTETQVATMAFAGLLSGGAILLRTGRRSGSPGQLQVVVLGDTVVDSDTMKSIDGDSLAGPLGKHPAKGIL